MSTPRKIAFFHGEGRNPVDLMNAIRAAFPGAAPLMMVPAVHLRRPYLLATLKQLRRERIDVLVLNFDSPKLKLAAALSGAKECWLCRLDGSMARVNTSLAVTLADILYRSIRGRLAYTWYWIAIRLFRIRI